MRKDGTSGLPALPSEYPLSHEFRLAVACSWIAPEHCDQAQKQTVRELCAAGIGWDAFLALVDRHGIPAQALAVFRRCHETDIPEEVLSTLKGRARKVAFRATGQMAEQIRVTRALRERGIESMPLKGVCLSQKLYGSPLIRSSADMDILIRPENFVAAGRLLKELGYRETYSLTERQTIAMLTHFHHLCFINRERIQNLELHWKNHFWSREEMEEFWRDCGKVTLAGETFNQPDNRLLFLFLCDHGSRHAWFRLKWLGDVVMMLAGGGLDAPDAVRLADRFGLRRVLAQTALLAHWLYNIQLPKALVDLIEAEKSSPVLAKRAIMEQLQGTEKHLKSGRRMEGLRAISYHRRIRPSIPLRLLLQDSVASLVDYSIFPLPDRLFWMYAPLRPVFWFWRHYGNRLWDSFPVSR